MQTSKVSTVQAFQQHLSYVFQRLQAGLEFYDQQRWKRLRWKAYIEKQKALHKFCKRLTGGDENTVIAFGDAKFSSVSAGNAPGPVRLFRKALERGRYAKAVVSIDEYRTSKVCSWCNHYKVKGMMSQRDQEGHRHEIHGVRVCPNTLCRIVWNRDLNAALNILKIFLAMAWDGRRPDIFRRSRNTSGHDRIT